MNLTGALQENILTLLCFDRQSAALIISSVDVDLFENSIYRNIAKAAIGYFRKYKKPAGDHLPDLLEDYLQDERKGKLYQRALQDIKDLTTTINSEFVLTQLSKFVRRQTLRKAITEAAARIQEDDLDKAEAIILKGVRARLDTFQPGLHLSDTRLLDINDFDRPDMVGMGIKVLDDEWICPARKELFTILGPRGRGKTWAKIHIGRFASMQQWKVAHITLEMSDKKCWTRYVQSFFSLTHREAASVAIPKFVRGTQGNLENIIFKTLARRRAITDASARAKIKKRIEETQGRMHVIVKQFPTSQLTTDGLVAYLDGLEASESFVPDMVIVDIPELMHLDVKNLRIDIGRQFRDIRGIAVERNLAMVAGSQTNRGGGKAKLVVMEDMSEDISKADISDNIVSLNQTPAEKKLGLMRLFVAKGRNEKSGQCVLIAQSYQLGQFCLDSMMLSKDYWPIVNRYAKKDADEDDDD